MSEKYTDHIRQALKKRVTPQPPIHVSMREVARQTHLSVSTISRFLADKPISSDALDRIADFLRGRYEHP